MSRIDQIRIASPCTALWTEMSGDDRARFCRLCQKTVYDSMGLDECELERIIEQSACVRVHRDTSGRVLTRDRIARAAAMAATAMLAACTGADTDSVAMTTDRVSQDAVIPEVSGARMDVARPDVRTPPRTVAESSTGTRGGIIAEATQVVTEAVSGALTSHATMGEPMPLPPEPPDRPTMGRIAGHEPPTTMMGGVRPMPQVEPTSRPTMGTVSMPEPPEMGKIAPPKE